MWAFLFSLDKEHIVAWILAQVSLTKANTMTASAL